MRKMPMLKVYVPTTRTYIPFQDDFINYLTTHKGDRLKDLEKIEQLYHIYIQWCIVCSKFNSIMPCPFCKSNKIYYYVELYNEHILGRYKEYERDDSNIHYEDIRCVNCGAYMVFDDFDLYEDVVFKWNRRANKIKKHHNTFLSCPCCGRNPMAFDDYDEEEEEENYKDFVKYNHNDIACFCGLTMKAVSQEAVIGKWNTRR